MHPCINIGNTKKTYFGTKKIPHGSLLAGEVALFALPIFFFGGDYFF